MVGIWSRNISQIETYLWLIGMIGWQTHEKLLEEFYLVN